MQRLVAVHADDGREAIHLAVVVQPEAVRVGVADLFVDVLHALGRDGHTVEHRAILVAAEAERGVFLPALAGRGIGALDERVIAVSADVLQIDLSVLFIGVGSVHGVAHEQAGSRSNLIEAVSPAVELVKAGRAPLIGPAVLLLGAAGRAIEVAVAQRAQTSVELRAAAADLAGVASRAIDRGRVIVLQSLAVAAQALEGHVPAGLLLGGVAVAVGILVVSIAGRRGMRGLLGDKTVRVGGHALADLNGIHIKRHGTVNDIAAQVGEFRTGGTVVAFHPQVARVLVIFELLHTVGLVARIAEQLVFIKELLIFGIILRE